VPAPAYSHQLYSRILAGADSFSVAAGIVCVVRDIDLTQAALTGPFFFSIYASGGVVFYLKLFGAGGLAHDQWQGRQVIPGPDTVNVVTTGSLHVSVSGYLLSAT
jgi:hypothetical protein